METVGDYLKRERESKRLSLGEVSRLTKISQLYLDYIEKDEFEKLPQGPYVKGYIASYSRLIGGNVDEVISLYDALYNKPAQTEDIQPGTPADNGGQAFPERAKTTERTTAKDSLAGKLKYFFNTAWSSLPIDRLSFKTAGSLITRMGSSIRTSGNWRDKVVPLFGKIASSKSWLVAFVALLGVAVLVLAGFGFYHLFIYNPNPLLSAELQQLPDKETRPLPGSGSEKSVLPLPSADPDAATPRTRSKPEGPIAAPDPVKPTDAGTLSPGSSSTKADGDAEGPVASALSSSSSSTEADGNAEGPVAGTLSSSSSSTKADGDAEGPAAGTESQVQVSQSAVENGQSPVSTAVDAPIKVLQASVCSAIQNRMPAGVDTAFPLSVGKVYVWSAIEANQIPSKIRHIYYLNGRVVSAVTLDVRSAYWRTWSSKRISRDGERGEWRVDIASTGGKVLRRLYFKVR